MERQRQREKQKEKRQRQIGRGRYRDRGQKRETERQSQGSSTPQRFLTGTGPGASCCSPSPTSHSHSEWGLGSRSPSCRCHTHRPQDPLGAPPAALGPHSPLSRRKCLCPGGEGLGRGGGGASKCLSLSDLWPLPLSLDFLTCEIGTTVFPSLSTGWAGLWGQPGGWGAFALQELGGGH